MSAQPPKPRPWPADLPKTIGVGGVRRMTEPLAWRLYSGVIGYHVPRALRSAGMIYDALGHVRQMASDWKIITQYPDVDTDGGSVARNVMVVGTETAEHGVYFERRYPRAQFKESVAKSDANGFTIIFELLFTIPGVDAVTWGQRLNAANQLEDIVTVYYLSTSGESSNYVVVPFRQLTQDEVAAQVKAGRAVLDANEEA